MTKTEKRVMAGVCCSCGYSGEKETACQMRDDHTHCEHWWDGPDSHEEALAAYAAMEKEMER